MGDAVSLLWVLASAALIFIMQAGFLTLEAGLVRPRNATVTALKVLINWMIVSLLWLLYGFGIAFGDSVGGYFGSSFWMGDGLLPPAGNGMGWVFFLFQLGFAGAAATIVSGAMAERVGFATYALCTVINGGVLYPLVAHWVWGNGFVTQKTFLSAMGFMDFAGSTVVHAVGGWISLASIWMLGPRLGRFDAAGKPRVQEGSSGPLAVLGVFLLWFGWWGFNGGSTLLLGQPAALVIVNTNLAACSAGVVAWLHARLAPPRSDVEGKVMGGALAGLVAITASANLVSLPAALFIGVLAGIAHNLTWELLLRLRLDDPVGAVPVHLTGGVLGTLCVALFGKQSLLARPRLEQLGVQALGTVVVMVLCVSVTVLLLALLKRTIGLRVSPRMENEGITLSAVSHLPAEKPLDADELKRLMGGGG